ncbi:PBSX family phage terminase large subunit [Amycolatopsis taiwanensis]|uniref:PBSX family phage terminase large subunit n=1 Tax=Amycolatopsis taiwanensis TaxID=342230 RepID=UPI0004AF3BBC|nr:phage terminase large subunit [Amycolatopsis taiwanensis]
MAAIDLARVTQLVSPKQIRSIVESASARLCVWTGAVRSGKTIGSLLAFLIRVAAAPRSGLIVIAGKTLQTIERNIIDPLQDSAIFGPVAGAVHHTRGSNTAVILGRTVHLLGANDKGAEGKFRGATVYLAYVDEATLIPEAVWNQILARLSPPGAQLLATTNPDGPAHWLRKNFLLRAAELRLATWTFTLDDNPHLDPAYVESLKREYVGLWYRRFIEGQWCLAEGAVYEMWDPARHVIDVLPPIERWVGMGVDYGTTNPFAALLLGMGAPEFDGARRLYLTHEWRWDSKERRRALTDHEYSERLRGWLDDLPRPHAPNVHGIHPEWTVVDPSAASFIQQLYRDGLTPTLADNSVLDGIRTVSSLLARDLLKVHKSCGGWLDEIGGYSWDPDKAERGEDAPIKVADHSLDAGRYVVHTTEALWRPHVQEARAA